MIYRFDSTPDLKDLEVHVGLKDKEIKFEVLGPKAAFFAPLIKLYFDWFNRIGPITTHEGCNVYSLYLPPIPSPGDARLLEGVFRDKLFGIPTPRAVTIAVTQDCQCKCVHCSAEEYSPSREMLTFEEIAHIIDESIAQRVGLTGQHIEDMYQIMAIANYEDRFVIPTAHRELGEDAYDLKGSCGFSFGNGCSDGRTETGLFGTPRAKTVRTPTEFIS